MLRDLALGLSLANLCYLRVWTSLLDPAGLFYLKFYPNRMRYAAAMLGVLLLGAALAGLLTLARRLDNKFGRILRGSLLLFLLLIIIPSFLNVLFSSGIVAQRREALIYFVVATLTLIALVAWPRKYLHAVETLALLMVAFVPVTYLQGARSLWNGSEIAIPDSAMAPLLPSRENAERVLWLVFDEFDERMTFLERPATVSLPELDRFRSQAIYAANAHPPGSETITSMPALLTGKPVATASPINSHELLVRNGATGEELAWSLQPNLFREARKAGFNTALAGWFLPYCRLIADGLTACSWQPGGKQDPRAALLEWMQTQAQTVIATIPWASVWVVKNIGAQQLTHRVQQSYAGAYQGILRDARRMVTDPTLDLILIHWPIPHPPGIYNRFQDDFAFNADSNYIDNLELVDRSLGAIRETMEARGLWGRTTVLVTSDHWWRTKLWPTLPFWTQEEADLAGEPDQRVPFLLKMRGQTEGVTYEAPFNTILTHDLILAILRGEFSTPQGVIPWLDSHRSTPPENP